MIFDPIANLISSLKNGYLAGKTEISVPHSAYKEAIANAICDAGFIQGVDTKIQKDTTHKNLILKLKYEGKKPAIIDINQVSKASLKVYVSAKRTPKILSGLGVSIISTPKGVMTSKKAKKLNLGGEIICNIW